MSEDKHYFEIAKHKCLELNDKWYIVHRNWFERWSKVVAGTLAAEHLPPISNSKLLDSNNDISSDILLNGNYDLVPDEVWQFIVKTYKIDCEQEDLFQRYVIFQHDSYIVEVQPLDLTISIFDKENKVTCRFSRSKTLNDIYNFVIEKFAVTKPLRILQKMDNGSYDVVKLSEEVTLGDAGLSNGEHIFIDTQDADGEWMFKKTKNKVQNRSIIPGNGRLSDGRVLGVCGLCNLGNTCFMNSAIQCISNVPPLTYYFIKNDWRRDLNVTNPLGMHGKLAERYYQLLEQIWIKGNSYTVPREFKVEVAKFAPQFSGYAQHDSQELMMFLLDGLHEDLNRVKSKPYQENKDDDHLPVIQKADDSWKYHKLRNDSVIVEYFHGLLKSTVVCPDCNYVSITFDPFASLSLPLIIIYPQSFTIRFWDLSRPFLNAKVMIGKTDSVKDFLDKIKELFPFISKSTLQLTEIRDKKIYRSFNLKEPVASFKDVDDLVVYELPNIDGDDEFVPVTQRSTDGTIFGLPFLLSVCKTEFNWDTVKTRLFQRVPYLRRIVVNNSDTLDPKMVKAEFEKLSTVFNIYLVDVPSQKSVLLTLETSKNLQSHSRYDIHIEWSKDGKDKFYDPEFEKLEDHESMQMKSSSMNVEYCLNEFIKTEKLGINDLWYCKKCKDQKAATKKFDLWKLPKVLILHLKRFRSGYYRRDKIDTFVEFPLTDLDLRLFVQQAHSEVGDKKFRSSHEVYDLVAVSNHMGGLGGGHYTAFAKNFIDNNWYLFDDSHTSKTSADSVKTKAAYVLVYVSQQSLEKTRLSLSEEINDGNEIMDVE